VPSKASGGPQPRAARAQAPLLFAVQSLRLVLADAREKHLVARPQLAELVEVGADDLRDLGIAADGLGIDAEHDALAVARHLHRTRGNRFRDEFARRHRQWLSLQAQ